MFHPYRQNVESSGRVLETRVAEYLSAHDAMVLPPLQIAACEGTVALRGLVDSQATRRSILALARQVPGVRRIVDEIEIPPAAEPRERHVPRHYFSAGLAQYFEERRLGLLSDSALAWDS